ncbi:MAG: DUF3015 family protein [Bdellovibrionales bacterium]|nr:DUF3015 family protein [Bdellovibrionales bacterium]
MKLFFIFIFMCSYSYSVVNNEGIKPQLLGEGRFGMAGCGFGSMIFEPREHRLFAMTFNHITSSQAFGISSGTSNCHDPLPTDINNARLPEFIENNKEQISEDAAKGNGETISVLAHLLQCKPNEVGHVLKENYKEIFVDTKMQSASIEAKINNYIDDNQNCF